MIATNSDDKNRQEESSTPDTKGVRQVLEDVYEVGVQAGQMTESIPMAGARFIDEALTSIINLVDKKVIGEDEKPFKLPPNTGMLLDSKMLGRNELRAEQRAKLKGEIK